MKVSFVFVTREWNYFRPCLSVQSGWLNFRTFLVATILIISLRLGYASLLYNLKMHSFTYRIGYKTLFYSKWFSHNNTGHVVVILTSKLRQISLSVNIKTLCLEPNNKSYLYLFARFPSGIFLNYYCGNTAIIRYSPYTCTYHSMRIMHISVFKSRMLAVAEDECIYHR